MIRINLLATAKPKKGKRGGRRFAMPRLTTDGPSPLVAGLALLVICGAGIYVYYAQLERTHDHLQAQIMVANRQIRSMSGVKKAYLARQRDYDAFKRRFDIIDQLRASQSGPVSLLIYVTNTVNVSDGVWLKTMHDAGNKVTMKGVALGPVAVANLMSNLKKSGYFKDVELKGTEQQGTGKGKVQTFSFALVCEKAKA